MTSHITMKTNVAGFFVFLLLSLALTVKGQPVLSIDINDRSFDPSTNTMPGFSSFLIDSNTSATAIQTAPSVRTFGAYTVTLAGAGPINGYDDRRRDTPVDSGAFTQGFLLRDFIFSRDNAGNGGLDVTINGLTANQLYHVVIWSFDSGSGGTRVSDWSVNGTLMKDNYTFDGRVLPSSNAAYRLSFDATADGSGTILIQGRRENSVDGNGAASFGVFLNAFQIAAPTPFITTQPAGGTRRLGDRMLFTVDAIGAAPLSYQWFKNGIEISGATSDSLSLSNLTVADSGDFTVQVTNSLGMTISSNATLTVLPDPAPDVRLGLVSYWPMDVINEEQSTTPDLYSHNDFRLFTTGFFDNAEGVFGTPAIAFNGEEQVGIRSGGFPIYNNPAFSVAFWVNGTNGQADRRFFAESTTNLNNPLFTLGSDPAGANGTMRVFIRNDAGGVLLNRGSTRITLDATWHHVVWTETNGQGKLYIDGVLDDSDFTYTRAGTLTLSQTAVGAIVRMTNSNHFAGALDDVAVWNRVLTFTEIQEIRTNSIPPPIMAIPPSITQQPASQSVLTRSKVTFSFSAIGTSPLDAQWRKNGTDLPGETNSTLMITNVMLSDAGDYTVVVTNSAGRATSEVATLTVALRPPPPTELKIDFNTNAPLEVTEPGFESFTIPTFSTGPFIRSFGGADVTLSAIGTTMESRKRTTPTNNGDFTQERLLQDFIFTRDAAADQGLDIAVEFMEENTPYRVSIWSFDTGSTGNNRISDWTANSVLVQSGYSFIGSTLPADNNSYRFNFNTTSDADGKILIQGRRNASAAGAINVFVNALQVSKRFVRIHRLELVPPDSLKITFEPLSLTSTFRIIQRTNVDAGTWTDVTDAFFSGPTGNLMEATFSVPDTATRFYRVVEEP